MDASPRKPPETCSESLDGQHKWLMQAQLARNEETGRHEVAGKSKPLYCIKCGYLTDERYRHEVGRTIHEIKELIRIAKEHTT